MTYRLRNIAIAVALAVLAAMMTSFYVKQQKQDIQQGQVLTTVWVAKSDIPAGSVVWFLRRARQIVAWLRCFSGQAQSWIALKVDRVG